MFCAEVFIGKAEIVGDGLSLWFRQSLSPAFHRGIYAAARPVRARPAAESNLLQRDLMQRDKPL